MSKFLFKVLHSNIAEVRSTAADQFLLIATRCSGEHQPIRFFITLLFTVLVMVIFNILLSTLVEMYHFKLDLSFIGHNSYGSSRAIFRIFSVTNEAVEFCSSLQFESKHGRKFTKH